MLEMVNPVSFLEKEKAETKKIKYCLKLFSIFALYVFLRVGLLIQLDLDEKIGLLIGVQLNSKRSNMVFQLGFSLS